MSSAVAVKTEEKKSHESHAATPAVSNVGPTGSFGATAGLPLFLQTKLIVGASGDSYEREADDVADVATRHPSAAPVAVSRISATPALSAARVQRKCSGCSGGAACSHCAEEEEKLVQRKALPGGNSHNRDSEWDLPPPSGGTHSETSPLPSDVRDRVEPVLGADLGSVRVHTGPVAWRSARALGARAFTHGRHIWLGQRESTHDLALMAHESAHVVQQTGGAPLPARFDRPSSRDSARLPSSHASRLSTSYGRDVSDVRVHTGSELPRRYGKDAVAFGDHVAFAPGAYRPGTQAGDTLIAHEVAHVVQQRGGATTAGRAPPRARNGAGLEGEARHAARSATRGGEARGLSAAPSGKPQGGFISFVEGVGGDIADVASDVGGGIYDAGSYVVGGAVDLAEDAVEYAADWIADRFWDVVRAIYAPAEQYLRDPSKLWQLIIDGVMSGIQGILGGLFSAFGADGVFGSIAGVFRRLITAAGSLVNGLASGACGPLAAALNHGVTALLEVTDAVLGPIKAAFSAVSTVITAVVSFIGRGIMKLLETVGGAIWSAVSSLVGFVAKIFRKVRSLVGAVWRWVKDLLGFSSDDSSSGGIWEWITDKVSAVWEGVKATLLGWVEPLKKVGGILLLISPIGPLILAFRYGPRIVHWIREIWKLVSDPHTITAMKEYVAQTLLPGAMSFLLEVANVFNGIAQGIAFALGALSKPLAELAETFDATRVLFLIAKAVRFFAGLVTDAVTWVADHIGPFFEAIGEFFKGLWHWLRPILDVVLKIIALANPVGIVMLLGSYVWLHIPDCIKLPIIRFILEFLIRVVDAIPDVPAFGPLWSLVKGGMLGFLRRLRGNTAQPDEAERALDRIARLVGGTADFALGLVVGILEGMWDGIIGPFQLVYMLIEGVGSIIDFFESLADQFPERVRSIIASVRGLADTVVTSFWPTIQGLLSGQGGSGGSAFDTVVGLLSKAWDAVSGAATEVGTSIAAALIGFIMLGDYDLGTKLGYVAGLVLFEVVLAILTAGVSAELEFFESAIGQVLRLLVKVNEAIGEVFGAIMKVIPGVEGAIARLVETLGDLPILRNVVGEFRRMFGQVEELALAGLRRFGGEAAGEGASVTARTIGTHADEAALATAGARTDEGVAARADAGATTAPKHPDTPAARDASTAETMQLDSPMLQQAQLDDELRHLADHPDLMNGIAPNRRARIGDHEWSEHPDGHWCRASGVEVCTVSPPELAAPGRVRPKFTQEQLAHQEEIADLLEASDMTFHDLFRSEEELDRFFARYGSVDEALTALEARARSAVRTREFMAGDLERGGPAAPAEGLTPMDEPPATPVIRARPGEVTGGTHLPEIHEPWFSYGSGTQVSRIPRQIGDRLEAVGSFASFRDFRETLWTFVGEDASLARNFLPPSLAQQLDQLGTLQFRELLEANPALRNQARSYLEMIEGRAPFSDPAYAVGAGSNRKLQLNHTRPLEQGGPVFDLDHIEIVTPDFHGQLGTQ